MSPAPKPPFPIVSDHALLRYLERGRGMDIAAIRRHIAELVRRGVEKQGDAVVIEGVKFVLIENRVVTTLEKAHFRSTPRRGASEGGDA